MATERIDPRTLQPFAAPTSDSRVRMGGDGAGPRQRAFELDAFTVSERLRSRSCDMAGEDPDRDWRLTQVMVATHIDGAVQAARGRIWPMRIFVRSDDEEDESWLCLDLLGERACPEQLQAMGERGRTAAAAAPELESFYRQQRPATVPLFIARFLSSHMCDDEVAREATAPSAAAEEGPGPAGAVPRAASRATSRATLTGLALLESSGRGLSVLEVSASPAEIREASHQLGTDAARVAPGFAEALRTLEPFPPRGAGEDELGPGGVGGEHGAGLAVGLPGAFRATVLFPHIDWRRPRCALAGCGATVAASAAGAGAMSAVPSVVGSARLKTCGACKAARYCSRAHQAEHWRRGHVKLCGKPGAELRRLLGAAKVGSPEVEFLEAELRAALALERRSGGCSVSGCGEDVKDVDVAR